MPIKNLHGSIPHDSVEEVLSIACLVEDDFFRSAKAGLFETLVALIEYDAMLSDMTPFRLLTLYRLLDAHELSLMHELDQPPETDPSDPLNLFD